MKPKIRRKNYPSSFSPPKIAGQLDQIAEEVYDTRLRIRVLQEENTSSAAAAASAVGCSQNVLVKYRLDFDNSAYVDRNAAAQFDRMQLPPIPVGVLLRLFPFGVIIDRGIRIMDAGEKLLSVWGVPAAENVRGIPVVDCFILRRPRDIPFTWNNVSIRIRKLRGQWPNLQRRQGRTDSFTQNKFGEP